MIRTSPLTSPFPLFFVFLFFFRSLSFYSTTERRKRERNGVGIGHGDGGNSWDCSHGGLESYDALSFHQTGLQGLSLSISHLYLTNFFTCYSLFTAAPSFGSIQIFFTKNFKFLGSNFNWKKINKKCVQFCNFDIQNCILILTM